MLVVRSMQTSSQILFQFGVIKSSLVGNYQPIDVHSIFYDAAIMSLGSLMTGSPGWMCGQGRFNGDW